MRLSCTISEINGEIANISHPYVYSAPAEGVPLGIGYQHLMSKTKSDGPNGPNKKFHDVFSHLDTIHQRDRQADGHRETAKTVIAHSVAR